MSAITGIWDFRAISASASASSWDGTATLTISQPAAVSSAICCKVALTSAVSVVVIDCTETGAPPPTGMACLPLPTMICREILRAASGGGGTAGRPRSTVMALSRLHLKVDGVEDVGRDQQRAKADQYGEDQQADGDERVDVYAARSQ